MNVHLERLTQYLDDLPESSPYTEGASILELLCHIYTEENPVDSATIRYRFRQLDCILKSLSWEDNNAFFVQVCTLCEEHTKLGFVSGLRMGYALGKELDTKKSVP